MIFVLDQNGSEYIVLYLHNVYKLNVHQENGRSQSCSHQRQYHGWKYMRCRAPLTAGGLIEKLCKSHVMNYLNSTPSENTSPTAIFDSGSTGKQIAVNPIEVKLPKGDFILSTHTVTVDIPSFPMP
jgi:hypothetical protein